MAFKEIICPVCGSNSVNETEDGRFRCASCGAVLESESAFVDTNAIMTYLNGSQFETAENYCRDAMERLGDTPSLNWMLFLAKNKIHFVDDTKSGERKPVFYSERVFKRDTVFDDENYCKAIQSKYSAKYRHFGELIEAIRIELCEKLSQESDTDIFVSFKATEDVVDSEGNTRTVDTFDQKKGFEIYDFLTSKGYKVFFSPVSIGKGRVYGEKYEPKIFAALASCRAMILIGTKKSYVTSGWVRDEWTRYLYFMNRVTNKMSRLHKGSDTLFYVYDKLPPDDLPSQISEIEGVDCSSAYYLDDLYKAIKARVGNIDNGIERVGLNTEKRVKKDTVEIDTIKTITLGTGEVAKRPSVIKGNLQTKNFGENKVDDWDIDTQRILDGAFAAIRDGNIVFARSELNYVLSTTDNASALYGKILLTINAKNEEEFVKNAEKFPSSEISLYHKLMSCASKEEATKATDLFVSACSQCFEDVEIREGLMFFNAVVQYNVPQRQTAIAMVKKFIPSLIKMHDANLKDVIDSFLSTIQSDKVDEYIRECEKIVKQAIGEGSFYVADIYNKKILELDEYNHEAMLFEMYIDTNSRNSAELEEKILSLTIEKIDYLVKHSSQANANKDLSFFCAAYLKKINELSDKSVIGCVESVENLLKYDFAKRNDVLVDLRAAVLEKSNCFIKMSFENTTDFLLKTFNESDVDNYLYYSAKVADKARLQGWFDIAESRYDAVLDVDNGNLSALYGKLFAGLKLKSDEICSVVDKFAYKDGVAVKNLENLLGFSMAAGTKTTVKYRFGNLVNKFAAEIVSALQQNKFSAEVVDAAYLNVIRYIPAGKKELMRKNLLVMASQMLQKGYYEIANKYYNQVLAENNADFDALWGCVLCEAQCRNADELVHCKNDFRETKKFISAYRVATREKQSELNEICKAWEYERNEKSRFVVYEQSIFQQVGVSCERDVVKSPRLLSTVSAFGWLIQNGSDYMVKKWLFIESVQAEYNRLEKEIQKRKEILEKLK